jgi:hypothetical protein
MNYKTFGIVSTIVMVVLKCLDEYYKRKEVESNNQQNYY